MGVVVQLSDYRMEEQLLSAESGADDSFVPVEFAVGLADREACVAKLAEYGLHSIQSKRVKSEPGVLLSLVRISDAIWLNKRILEREDLSDEAIARHIDIVQTLENLNLTLMESLWASFTYDAEH
ncbi:MAG: hypothetical protein MI746_18400 [Pseudomonadales bacterium]|nr:hypothetical protein [Pseudomonadales bacterium]